MARRIHVTRTRKYRYDGLVHLATHDEKKASGRTMRITCSAFWVFPRQLEEVDEPVTCLSCIVKETV